MTDHSTLEGYNSTMTLALRDCPPNSRGSKRRRQHIDWGSGAGNDFRFIARNETGETGKATTGTDSLLL